MYYNYAKIWRQKIRDKELIRRLKTDVHAPPMFRTNIILSNIKEFQEIFNITKNHQMYIHDDDMFKLWYK